MFTKTRTLFVGTLVLAAASAFALEPVENIDPARHGNLAAAQQLVRGAFDRLSDALANDYRLGGHAVRAKELLQQARENISLAAMAANQR